MKLLNIDLEWLGHASFMINNNIYIDPFRLKKGKAKLILVTHKHYDHYDQDSIKAIKTPETKIIGPKGCKMADKVVEPGMKFKINGVKIEVVQAYNIGKEFHPKGLGVGYIIETNGTRVYHAGDTDRIPEMKKINTDIALLPVGGKYTMDSKQAAKAANDIKPKIVVPMHYGTLEATKADLNEFKNCVENSRVVIFQ